MMSGLQPPLSLRTSTMSHPTCCSVSLDRCDRCDLLVDLEGFHLVSVARRECGLVLDIESCDRCAGCPGRGVTCSRSRACGATMANAAGACVNSLASWTTRGKDHPTARLSGLGAGQVWHRVQELADRARRRLARGCANCAARFPALRI